MRAWLRRWSARADRVAAWGTRVLRGRVVRLLWLAGASLAAVLGLGFGTLQAASLVAHEERTEVTDVAVGGLTSLTVDNDGGSVTLVGVDGRTEVTVRADISDGLRDTGHSVDRRGDVLLVQGSCPVIGSEWCRVDYTIEMPADMYASVTGDGGVSATGLEAGVAATSDHGGIELVRVRGDVRVEADQGSIDGDAIRADHVDAEADQGRISLDLVSSPRTLRAKADQGSIDVVLPDAPGVYYATDLQADQGSVTSTVREKSDSERTLTAEADQGSITIGYAADP
jgi:hypothetical protein